VIDGAEDRAKELLLFAGGFEEAGFPELARRASVVAGDCLEALAELEATRSAFAAVTADRDRWRDDRWRETHGEAWPA
jgi:hypothetical protein